MTGEQVEETTVRKVLTDIIREGKVQCPECDEWLTVKKASKVGCCGMVYNAEKKEWHKREDAGKKGDETWLL
jgi:hypothetical protein